MMQGLKRQKIYITNHSGRKNRNTILLKFLFIELLILERLVPPNKSDKSSPKIEADGAFRTDAEVDAALCDPLAVPLA